MHKDVRSCIFKASIPTEENNAVLQSIYIWFLTDIGLKKNTLTTYTIHKDYYVAVVIHGLVFYVAHEKKWYHGRPNVERDVNFGIYMYLVYL